MAESKEYTVSKVSPKTKTWESKYGQMVTYYLLLEGEGQEPVEINKKPDSTPPKAGDTIYGTLTDSGFGMKFKSEKRPDGARAGGYSGYQKDDKEIRALSCMKEANSFTIAWLQETKGDQTAERGNEVTRARAQFLYNLVDELKGTTPPPAQSDEDKVKAVFDDDEIPEDKPKNEIPF